MGEVGVVRDEVERARRDFLALDVIGDAGQLRPARCLADHLVRVYPMLEVLSKYLAKPTMVVL